MRRRSLWSSRLSRDSMKCDTSHFLWMPNKSNKDPCELAQDVLRLCQPKLELGTLHATLSCDASNDLGNCCCSTATYALLSACWVCQGNELDDIQQSYRSFFGDSHCKQPSIGMTFPPALQEEVEQLNLPQWSLLRPPELTSNWRIRAAAAASLPSSSSTFASISTRSMPPTSLPPTFSSGSIAAAVLGTLAGAAVVTTVGWFLRRWHRRRILRPKSGPRVDLTDPGVEAKSSRGGVDLLSGEQDNPPRSPTFPFPFEWFFRRYHPDAPHSIEPRSDYGETTIPRTRQIAPPLPVSVTRHEAKVTFDQLDRDLANLSGTAVRDLAKPRTQKSKRIPRLSISKRDGSGSQHSTGSTNSESRRGRHHCRKSKGKYYHLPPSAQYLADVARFPQSVDPERPWAKPPRLDPEN